MLAWAGVSLLPVVAIFALVASHPCASRPVLIDIIATNALWIAASFGLLFQRAIEPSLLGYAFVILQALIVALFAELQFIDTRRAFGATA